MFKVSVAIAPIPDGMDLSTDAIELGEGVWMAMPRILVPSLAVLNAIIDLGEAIGSKRWRLGSNISARLRASAEEEVWDMARIWQDAHWKEISPEVDISEMDLAGFLFELRSQINRSAPGTTQVVDID
ncbi:MAG: hypothetical protein R3F20_13675 [Planctomycetota bacterium]